MMNLRNDYNSLKLLYPIKDFNAEIDYVEINENKHIILYDIRRKIRRDLYKRVETYWGHANFDVLIRTDFHLAPIRINDKEFKQVYQLEVVCAYYDGDKEKIIFVVSYKLNDIEIKVETEELPKKNKDFVEIHKIVFTYLEDLKINA